MSEPTTEAGRDLLVFLKDIRGFAEDSPVLSPSMLERIRPKIAAIEAEAAEQARAELVTKVEGLRALPPVR